MTQASDNARQALKEGWGRLERLCREDHEPHVLSVRADIRIANERLIAIYHALTGDPFPDAHFSLGEDPRDHKAMWKALKKNRAKVEKALGEPL